MTKQEELSEIKEALLELKKAFSRISPHEPRISVHLDLKTVTSLENLLLSLERERTSLSYIYNDYRLGEYVFSIFGIKLQKVEPDNYNEILLKQKRVLLDTLSLLADEYPACDDKVRDALERIGEIANERVG
jgi:hypothetical protein